jgi:histone H3/H4
MAAARKQTDEDSVTDPAEGDDPAQRSSVRRGAASASSAARRAAQRATRSVRQAARRGSVPTPDILLVASQVKEAARRNDVRMSAEFVHALNDETVALIDRAIERARENGRSTVRPSDL